jgi:simple sugar transport system ATP-binding protein
MMMTAEIDDAVGPGVHLRGIEMTFNAVRALKGVDFSVRPGEVVGLVGDNGAGKSTLAKVMAGALSPDNGRIVIDGTVRSFSNVRDSHSQGITMLFQDLALCDDLNVADNFFVGREPTRFGVVRHRWMHAETRRNLEMLDIRLQSTRVPVRLLSGGQRQSVAIARAVSFAPRVLILDEPTAALGVRQAKATLDTIRRLRANRIGIVLISHRMTDVLSICDRVTVLYEGRVAADLSTEGLTVEEIVRYIVTDPDAERPVADRDRASTQATAER